jgi:hypothetical protein
MSHLGVQHLKIAFNVTDVMLSKLGKNLADGCIGGFECYIKFYDKL